MVRDLSEFGYPKIFLDTRHISLVTFRDLMKSDEPKPLPKGVKPLQVRVIIDGQWMSLEYDQAEEAWAKAAYDFFKKCIIENEKK